MPNALVTAATSLLAAVETIAGEQGVTLPARRYISPGAAGNEAWDTEQVTVALVQLDPAHASIPGEQIASTVVPAGVPSLPTAVLRAEIVRCVPTVDVLEDGTERLPPLADDQAAAVRLLDDAWVLHVTRARVIREGLLTGGAPGDIRAGAVVPSGPQGGLAGMNLTVAVTLL